MANVKLGNNTLTGVTTVRLQNADAAGEYVSFGLGAAPAGTYVVSFNVLGSIVGQIAIPQGQSLTGAPYVPTADGYTFKGWQVGGAAVVYPYTPTGNETWTANMSAVWRYGVSGLGNSNPALTRTYNNVGKTYSINSAAGTITTDFDNLFNFETVVQDGNTMIKIPVMYKHFDTITSNQLTAFSISNTKIDDEWQPYPCFVKQDGSGAVMDYILISKGKATGTSSKATCVSGSKPLVNVTRAQMRTAARANGAGWQQFDWMVLQLLRDLFCVVFATTDSQSIFLGRTRFSNAATVGNTWNISTPCGWNITTMQNRFFGIEDVFGNVRDLCDGVTFSGPTIYSTTSPNLFSDDTSNLTNSGTRATNSYSFITSLGYNTSQPFLNYPSAASGGSQTSYYCDTQYYSSSGVVLGVGGEWDFNSEAGLWQSCGGSKASDAVPFVGGRLVYRPV